MQQVWHVNTAGLTAARVSGGSEFHAAGLAGEHGRADCSTSQVWHVNMAGLTAASMQQVRHVNMAGLTAARVSDGSEFHAAGPACEHGSADCSTSV